tara:strand:- start:4761 stop:4988 length:228 start_codon:yes stop_codon:yes gene_type:complete
MKMNELIAIGLTIVSFGVLGKLLKKEDDSVKVIPEVVAKPEPKKKPVKKVKKETAENVTTIEQKPDDDSSQEKET